MGTRRIEVEGASIAYEEMGQGFPLVALHGFYPDRRLMTGAFEPCFGPDDRIAVPPSAGAGRPGGGPSRRTYRRLYPDLPFMGESSNPAGVRDSDDMLRVVAELVRQLVPEGPFLLAGESYGGYLARGLAREFDSRVAGLLLLCPMIVALAPRRDVPPHGALRVEPGYGAEASPEEREEFDSVAVVRDAYTWDRSAREVFSGVHLARSRSLELLRLRGYAFGFDQAEEGEAPFDVPFEAPALFVLGRQDSMVGWKDALRLAERYPRATFAVLDTAGHNAQIEQSGLLQALAGEWIGRCEDRREDRG